MSAVIAVSRWVLPFLAVVILAKCLLPLLLGHPKEKTYGYLIDNIDGERYALNMWETSIGRSKGCDIVIGSRFVTEKKPLTGRMIGSRLIGAMIRLMTGRTIKDPTSGMRMYSKRLIRTFAENSRMTPEPDTVCHLMRLGAKVTEVQVVMDERIAGTSYLNLSKSIRYMLTVSISILFEPWIRSDRKLAGKENA